MYFFLLFWWFGEVEEELVMLSDSKLVCLWGYWVCLFVISFFLFEGVFLIFGFGIGICWLGSFED